VVGDKGDENRCERKKRANQGICLAPWEADVGMIQKGDKK
jgi:hypothetical protein